MKHRFVPIVLAFVLLAVVAFVGAATLLPKNTVHAGAPASVAPPPPEQHHAPPAPSQVGLGLIDASKGPLNDGQIRAFIESHKFVGGDVVGGGNPHVAAIVHTTAGDYSKKHGITMMLPVNEPLALVTLSGPFHLTHANAPRGEAANLAKYTFPTVHELIDINSGNLEAWTSA